MLPTPKRWDIAPEVPDRQLYRLSHLHHLVVQILRNRGVTEPEEVDAFLNRRERFDNPSRMLGIPEAVDRIRAAIRAGETIVVYGDFDADGVTATALLVQTLEAFGAAVKHYIPHRVDDGYGLNCDALYKIASWDTRLVITVDCGIRSADEVAYGNGLGLDMIVTDHHSIQQVGDRDILPPALAVINPKQAADPYPFRDFAGVGLAFKLAQALLLAEKRDPVAYQFVTLTENDLLDLVALGTVADLAPLLGENRALVQRGLAELNHPRRPGIQAMLEEAGLASGRVNATAIGFVLGPRLNAAGRLDSARISYDLLTAPDILTAQPLAARLGELNRKRQDLTQQRVSQAKSLIAADQAERLLYLVSHHEFEPGIVGLVAGRLTEEFYRPVLVARVDADSGETHGSARSIPEFNITAALDECRDLLVRHGGHAAAAGFTVLNDNLPALRERLEEIAARELAGKELQSTLDIDAEVDLSEMDDFAFYELVKQLEPFGYANAQPIFAAMGLDLVKYQRVGTDGQHLKLIVRDPESGKEWEAIAFRQGEWFGRLPRKGIDIAFALELNDFDPNQARRTPAAREKSQQADNQSERPQNKPRLQLNVKDIRPSEKAHASSDQRASPESRGKR